MADRDGRVGYRKVCIPGSRTHHRRAVNPCSRRQPRLRCDHLSAVDGLNTIQGALGNNSECPCAGWVINGTTIDVYANPTDSAQSVDNSNTSIMQIHLTM